jgi:1-phosphatidylinositol-4-phosphate 5-kinase
VNYKQRFDRLTPGTEFTLEQLRNNMGILGVQATSAIADRIFNAMDKSGTDSVTFEEYLDYMYVLTQGTDDQKSEQTFRLFTKEKKD